LHCSVATPQTPCPDASKRALNTMAGLKIAKTDGTILDGGAILDENGSMVGSVVLCRFPDRAALDAYLEREIYAREQIWNKIEVVEMRFVDWP
jgi:hypothetical protein